jgi:hypothetical protein
MTNETPRARTSGLRHASEIIREGLGLERLPVTHPKHPDGFTLSARFLTLYWDSRSYRIERSRIDTPLAALGWIAHCSEKGWEGATAARISNLIRALATANSWRIDGL